MPIRRDALVAAGTSALAHRERAFAAFLRQTDPGQAAIAALWLCIDYRQQIGNIAASAGWITRLARLINEFELEPIRGWLLVVKAMDRAEFPKA
ncbi:MAG: hypothetical protein M3387_08565 [Actinomycetota bacterium]|nr:hypothetical protein [Actinomycetota bacterium]